MCERLALKKGIKLGPKFWADKEWINVFKRQHTLANKFLKMYSEGAIIQAISKMAWVFSLSTQKLITEIERLHSIENQAKPDVVETEIRKDTSKKNILELI